MIHLQYIDAKMILQQSNILILSFCSFKYIDLFNLDWAELQHTLIFQCNFLTH